MPEAMDLVQERCQIQLEDAIAEQRRKLPHGTSLAKCCVCHGEIPEERRWALPGVAKCYECQFEYEQMHGRG